MDLIPTPVSVNNIIIGSGVNQIGTAVTPDSIGACITMDLIRCSAAIDFIISEITNQNILGVIAVNQIVRGPTRDVLNKGTLAIGGCDYRSCAVHRNGDPGQNGLCWRDVGLQRIARG